MLRYEDAAAAFLQQFPLETKVRGEDIITFAKDHANGLANDLLIGDDSKKLSAVRRHLNSGGASRSFAEEERFYIDVSDAKRNIYVIRKLADHVHDKATMAFGKSVNGALSPINTSKRAIEDIKLEELDEADRNALEARMNELTALQTPLKKLFHSQTIERWVFRLEARGYSKEQARNLVELLPTLTQELKLIKATS
jgi:energy-coupling factor transporter ATP-binding protein EcfA2